MNKQTKTKMEIDKIDELLDELNGVCISYDSYKYGLPNDDVTKQMLRDTVVAWLEKHTGV